MEDIFLIDGGKLYDSPVPAVNRFSWYRTQALPTFGLVLQGLESRLDATGWNYYGNMVRDEASGYVFEDREMEFTTRGDLNGITGDTTPVILADWVSGDFATVDDYHLQFRAEKAADATRKEYFPIIHVSILEEV